MNVTKSTTIGGAIGMLIALACLYYSGLATVSGVIINGLVCLVGIPVVLYYLYHDMSLGADVLLFIFGAVFQTFYGVGVVYQIAPSLLGRMVISVFLSAIVVAMLRLLRKRWTKNGKLIANQPVD